MLCGRTQLFVWSHERNFRPQCQGKSTIADAISYAITGVSFFGSNRMDRLRAPGKNISVELQIVDGEGQPHCLIRNRVGDNTDVFWDGQPIAAKDLNTVFAERDLFLAVFNPLYLIEVLGTRDAISLNGTCRRCPTKR